MKKYPDIKKKLSELLPIIREKYNVDTLEIFGSYVHNENDAGSDLDILVTFNVVPGLIKFIELENYLTDNLSVQVDLVMKDSLKPRLKERILNEAVKI